MNPLELIAEADKKAKPSSGIASFFGGGSSSYRHEEAADLYTQAANQYRLQKNALQAGKIFEKASASYLKADSPDEAAASLVEAYKAYKTSSYADAARCLSKAIEHWVNKGNFRRACSSKCDLAELYIQLNEKENAIKSYEDAGDWYLSDDAKALSSKCYLLAADLKAEIGQFVEASQTYETVGIKSLESATLKYSTKDYFSKLVLCKLAASDYPGALTKLETFGRLDHGFTRTREYGFLNEVLDAVKERDPDLIGKASAKFDQFSRLNDWQVSILSKIKNSLTGGEESGMGDGMDVDDLT